jgi:ribulose-5-phosphate 4-epimerase/fuculose-1-phosphate aldolase
MKKIVLIGGGTFSHVRSHLALAAPAFGKTVATIRELLQTMVSVSNISSDSFRMQFENDPDSFVAEYGEPDERYIRDHYEIETYLTKMVDPESNLVTNEDISKLVDELISDPTVRVIVFNPALVDFDGQIGDVTSGKYAERMRTDQGDAIMTLTPTDKIIGRIRKHRKDIFVVGFKTTNGASSNEQFIRGLELLKKNSLNLVVANDPKTRNNMIITPEETRYAEGTNRYETLSFLAKMIMNRMRNKFTRSTVVEGSAVDWNGPEISDTLRTVVNHCIAKGAYKPFLGKTAGHFATKVSDTEIITSIRKTNYNKLDEIGMVRIKSKNDDEVIAYGFKPSVGGQSQRIIFKEHPEMDSIVHFHTPHKDHIKEIEAGLIPGESIIEGNHITVRPQWANECGSHQCGKNTSNGLTKVDLGDGDIIKVVYLDNHGPNIVFNSKINPQKIINYIDRTFDLDRKTGGLFQ